MNERDRNGEPKGSKQLAEEESLTQKHKITQKYKEEYITTETQRAQRRKIKTDTNPLKVRVILWLILLLIRENPCYPWLKK
ncbi:MAG: hypothetical protein WC155_03790 [Candidatus Cloacimonadales bacterium]